MGTLEVLVVNIDGEFFCTSARCPHAGGAPLAEGTLKGKVLTCPWHEAQFRVTDGQVLRGPATENLIVYRTIVKENQIFIEPLVKYFEETTKFNLMELGFRLVIGLAM